MLDRQTFQGKALKLFVFALDWENTFTFTCFFDFICLVNFTVSEFYLTMHE